MTANPCRIVIPVRLSYCHIAEPRPDDERTDDAGNPLYSYNTQCIISKTDKATQKKIQTAVQHAIAKKFGKDKVAAYMKNPNFKKPLRDADAEDKDAPEYKNTTFFNCKTNAKFNNAKDVDEADPNAQPYTGRPGCVLKNRTRLTSVADISKEIYSGAYVFISVTAYYFKATGSQGIAFGLNNVMKDRDGERLDGTVDADDEFADLFEEDDLTVNTDNLDKEFLGDDWEL